MEYLKVLLPTLVVGLIFWYVLRSIIRSDKIEREQMEKYYAQLRDTTPTPLGDTELSDSSTEKGGIRGSRNETDPH